MSTRRKFISDTLKASATLSIAASSQFDFSIPKSDKKLNILILGGTSFLGPHQIAYALEQGHSITTFTRGKTQPSIHKELFKDVEQLIGDREDNLEALKNRSWDAIIDNSGRKVKWTDDTAKLLKDNVELYVYISSVSVFYPYYKDGLTEDDPLVLEMPADLESEDEKYSYDYGIMKANSELAAAKHFGKDRTIVVRPHFMVGPADRVDRFMYYPTQLAKGGDIIVPGEASNRVQYIDVRDISAWMIRLIENKSAGIYNGAGPGMDMNVQQFVYGAHSAFSSNVNYVHIDDPKFLEEQGLAFQAPWVLPLPKYKGMSTVSNQRAVDSGLTFRPLSETIKDTHDWWHSDAVSEERRENFENNPQELANRQKAIIEAWNNR